MVKMSSWERCARTYRMRELAVIYILNQWKNRQFELFSAVKEEMCKFD